MLIASQTSIIERRFGAERAIEMLSQAGFDAFDFTFFDMNKNTEESVFGDNYREYMLSLKGLADRAGIICNQAHAHFPSEKPGDEEYNAGSFTRTVHEMECAALLGAKHIVIHPVKGMQDKNEEFEYNMDFFNRLLPYAKKFKIKIALENMFVVDRSYKYVLRFVNGACGTGDEFVKYMRRLDPDWFIACIDTGHSGISGQKVQYAIRQLGHGYLHALHVQDNNFFEDTHTAPYFGLIDWDEVCKALADIDYDGEFTFEAHRFLERIPEPLFMDTLELLYKIGRYLVGRIETLKAQRGDDLV